MVDKTSEIGNDIQIPNSPKKIGKIYMSGIKNMACLVNVNNNAGNALPIA